MSFLQETQAADHNEAVKDKLIADLRKSRTVLENTHAVEFQNKELIPLKAWCNEYGISIPTFYRLKTAGHAPETTNVKSLRKVFISKAANIAWLKDQKNFENVTYFSPKKIKLNQ